MNRTRTITLVGAAVLTAVATIAYLGHWTDTPHLRTLAVAAWIIFAIATGTDRIVNAITKLREDIGTYGDLQRSDGIVDGLRHTNPAQPHLTRVRG